MPYKSDKFKLNPDQDRRRKLTEEQKAIIKEKYKTGKYSYQSLANQYGVSKSLICITINEKRAENVKNRGKEHWKEYYDKEKHAKAIKKLRRYKRELYIKGELENTEE